MTKEKNNKEFNPLQAYLMMGAGVSLIIIRLIDDVGQWSTLDIIKFVFGFVMIGYGVFKLVKKK